MTVNDLKEVNEIVLNYKIKPATWCDILNAMGITKFEKLDDGYIIIQNRLLTRIIFAEEKNDEKKTS